jgi:ABC-type antimicrobial peptide transport system permease subunit
MALGASRAEVIKLIFRRAALLTFAGLVIGLMGSVALTRFISAQLHGVHPTDPMTLASVCILLMFVGFLAAWSPARRAAKVDPMETLRNE